MKSIIFGVLVCAAVIVPTLALAQAYPSRPVKVVVPYAAGGSTDGIARIISDSLSRALNQQFVVENRPGAGGAISAEFIAKAPAGTPPAIIERLSSGYRRNARRL